MLGAAAELELAQESELLAGSSSQPESGDEQFEYRCHSLDQETLESRPLGGRSSSADEAPAPGARRAYTCRQHGLPAGKGLTHSTGFKGEIRAALGHPGGAQR
jgi:hypothetical protein